MLSELKTFVRVFLFWTLLGSLSKVLFMLCHAGVSVDIFPVMWHGLRLDLAVAAYFTAPFALLLIVSSFLKGKKRWMTIVWKAISYVCSFLFVLAILSNIALYGYWGFPLDTTPLFYLTTSPADAMASTPLWQNVFALVLLVAGTWVVARSIYSLPFGEGLGRWAAALVRGVLILLLSALLFIPIRGGFTVATNNTGSVYFSDNMLLNHAAVNPVFSFLESAFQEGNYGEQYRFMDDDEARQLADGMKWTEMRERSAVDSVFIRIPSPLSNGKNIESGGCNVVVVVLESFSYAIMQEAGNEMGVVPNLDTLSNEGLYFTNFYANSFRTDRGLVSILSGFPSQPTMSLMKVASKTNNLSGIARTLRQNGYTTDYYYGGDANFTKMRSYLMQTGFERVFSEDDFPSSARTGKWGVPDGPVFDRLLSDIREYDAQSSAEKVGKPFLKVLQTSSSHEPFEVPYEAEFHHPALKAFAYVDDCLGRFVREFKQMDVWQNTLLVLVPDHLGGYPAMDNYNFERYHIPFILSGGVVRQAQRFDTVGSQIDIPATLLALLGYDHSDFAYSKDLFDSRAPHFAYFSFPDAMGFVAPEGRLIWDNTQQKLVTCDSDSVSAQGNSAALLTSLKAYLQTIYDDIDAMGK